MTRTNQSFLSQRAQQSKEFTFLLWDRGQLFPFDIVRNGGLVACSGEYTLFVAPEELTKEQDARTTVTQTPNGSWVDSFGGGLTKWTLRGSTGWKARKANRGISAPVDGLQDGYTSFHVFSDMIATYWNENQTRAQESFEAGRILRPLIQLLFHDHADDEWWVVEPEGAPTKRRSVTRPLLYEYEFRFIGIRDLSSRTAPIADAIGQALLGGDTRDQKTADAFMDGVDRADVAIDGYEDEAAANPTDAAAMDAQMEVVLSRGGMTTPESWTPEEVTRITTTAGPPSSAFNLRTAAPSFLKRCREVMVQAKQVSAAVNSWRKQVSSFIAAPIKTLTECMSGVRDVMNAISFASNAFHLTATMRSALRLLRTELRNLWCAGQSLLSFPYNFVQGLKATAQTFLDLFKLSGCATTFPYVKALSWQGPQMTIPTPTK